MDIIDQKCGSLTVGWVFMGPWNKSYGREVDSVEICPGICRIGICGMIKPSLANGVA